MQIRNYSAGCFSKRCTVRRIFQNIKSTTWNTYANDDFNGNFRHVWGITEMRGKKFMSASSRSSRLSNGDNERYEGEDATRGAQSVTDHTRFNVGGSSPLLSRVPGEVGKNRSRTPTRLEAKRPTTTTRYCVHPLTKRDWPRLPRHVCSGNRTTFLSHVRATKSSLSFSGCCERSRRASDIGRIPCGKLRGARCKRNNFPFVLS